PFGNHARIIVAHQSFGLFTDALQILSHVLGGQALSFLVHDVLLEAWSCMGRVALRPTAAVAELRPAWIYPPCASRSPCSTASSSSLSESRRVSGSAVWPPGGEKRSFSM